MIKMKMIRILKKMKRIKNLKI